MRIITGDFSDRHVDDLIDTHLCTARAETAPGSAHGLAVTAFQAPNITFWTIWDDQMLVGFGALERLSNHPGELKSMHTTQAMRRMGAGSVMLRHTIATARATGVSRLSLNRAWGSSMSMDVTENDWRA